MTSANLHLYRKYQVFHNKIKCIDDVEPYIHVFNKIGSSGSNIQYLGKFDVTDYYVNEHSIEKQRETKTAIIFELTPLCGRRSDSIDKNYIME